MVEQWAERASRFARLAFRGIAALNLLQSVVFPAAYRTNENLLICAPTGDCGGRHTLALAKGACARAGAGKTNVAMLAVCREVNLAMLRQCPSRRCLFPCAEFEEFHMVRLPGRNARREGRGPEGCLQNRVCWPRVSPRAVAQVAGAATLLP